MLRVLVVDDSSAMRVSVGLVLKEAGFEIFDAESGEAALRVLDAMEGGKPDLFMLDLNLPGMDGIELARQLRARPNHRFTPILLLTKESATARREEARVAGASGWLVKPAAPADLLRVVRQVCPKCDSSAPRAAHRSAPEQKSGVSGGLRAGVERELGGGASLTGRHKGS